MKKELNKIIEKLAEICKAHRMTIVTAESCTGGGIAFEFSKSKECSSILERGFVSYSNQSKESLLNVKPESLQVHGTVSQEVAVEMAEGAIKNSIAQVGLAVTGIAGEDYVDGNKGIVWIAISIIDKKTISKKLTFEGSREKFINFVIFEGISFLLRTIEEGVK